MKSIIFECKICLWLFESKDELCIHNYLEHMIGCRNGMAETDSVCNGQNNEWHGIYPRARRTGRTALRTKRNHIEN